MKRRKYTKEALEEAAPNCISYLDMVRYFGKKPHAGLSYHIKKACEEFGVDCSHFKGSGWSRGRVARGRAPLEVLVKGMGETLRAVADLSTRRGRELRYRQRELELRSLELANLREEQSLERERQIEQRASEDERRKQEIHELEIEERRIRLSIHREQLHMAEQIFRRFSEAHFSRLDQDPDVYIARLLPHVGRILSLDLDLKYEAIESEEG